MARKTRVVELTKAQALTCRISLAEEEAGKVRRAEAGVFQLADIETSLDHTIAKLTDDREFIRGLRAWYGGGALLAELSAGELERVFTMIFRIAVDGPCQEIRISED